jgi:hypothetical protein
MGGGIKQGGIFGDRICDMVCCVVWEVRVCGGFGIRYRGVIPLDIE